MSSSSVEDPGARVPRLSASCDPSGLTLSPVEGFLLSRIDGATSWKLLREIGGLSPDEVDQRLGDWLKEGIVEIVDPNARKTQEANASSASKTAVAAPSAEIDESLDLDIATQQRILDFEAKLDASYHDLLGVSYDTDSKAIKKAYFKLSKEFHPDRYFRRDIGPFEKSLECIFKRILEAYELLSDPTVRAEIEKSMSAAAAQAPPQAPVVEVVEEGKAAPPPRPLTKIERLRMRMPFKLPASVLQERTARAREFWDAGSMEAGRGSFVEAASKVRLAIAFDPFNDLYREEFGNIQARAAEMRAEQLVAEADAQAEKGMDGTNHFKEVLRLYEEALLYRPHQPELNDKAARAAIQVEAFKKGLEYAETALAHSPEVARYHVTLAMVHRAAGNHGHALKTVEEALGMEASNAEAAQLRAELKAGRLRKTAPR